MSEIQWRVGDTGLTRDGRRYEVVEYFGNPGGVIVREEKGSRFAVTGSGRYFGEGRPDSSWDLMPPDPRGDDMQPVPADPPATTDERLVELSGRVLVEFAAATEGRFGAEYSARWAVDAARALLRECGA